MKPHPDPKMEADLQRLEVFQRSVGQSDGERDTLSITCSMAARSVRARQEGISVDGDARARERVARCIADLDEYEKHEAIGHAREAPWVAEVHRLRAGILAVQPIQDGEMGATYCPFCSNAKTWWQTSHFEMKDLPHDTDCLWRACDEQQRG
jgi:hypothetical protein